MSFDSYFSNKNIIDILCRIRATDAQKRHDRQFYRNISSKAANPNRYNSIVSKMLPSRKQWYRPKYKERLFKTSFDINYYSLIKSVEYYIKYNNEKDKEWYKKLQNFLHEIKLIAMQSTEIIIEEPEIIPVEKEKNKKKEKKKKNFRPIALYELKDRIIIGLTAKYLRDAFDQDFLNNSYAFRSKLKNEDEIKSHHMAIRDILLYKMNFINKNLYVTECDIQKFYDTVNHDVARESLNMAIKRANDRGNYVDSRAIQIFEAYLNSYTFCNTAFKKAGIWFKKNNIDTSLEWPKDDLLQFYNNIDEELIGVPQGGALSPLIANLVLDRVDRLVINESEKKNKDLFYARYCDDMVIIHPNKQYCKNMLSKYIKGLKSIRLAPHSPKTIKLYSKSFYEFKSKEPYKWARSDGKQNHVPWLSFLGYQIRYDNKLRIRKTSFVKELEKQVKIADSILNILNSKHQVTNKTRSQILFRLKNKLISMSVGRIKIGDRESENMKFCWCSGFKELKSNEIISNQLKQLDRNREKQISRVKRRIKKLRIKPSQQNKNINAPKYYGAPFSYYSQFTDTEKLSNYENH